jgi:menaquinone-specific isochorismate synthase
VRRIGSPRAEKWHRPTYACGVTSEPLPRSAAAPLVVRTVEIPDPGPLVSLLPGSPDDVSWVRRNEGLVGWGRAAECRTSGSGRFAEAQRWWRDLTATAVVRDEVDLPGTGPVAFGSFSFDASSSRGGTLVVPEVVVGRRGNRWWVTSISAAAESGAVLPSIASVARGSAPTPPAEVRYADGAISSAQWESAVAVAVQRIGSGELDKVVLARDLEARASAPVDPRWLLQGLVERYAGTWVYAVDGLVGATPELLCRLERGLVTSRVLAGTIRRTGDDDHDLALAGSLARSSKDLEEHEYAAASVADSLAPHCSSLNLPESPFVLHLPNVMHLATDIAGVVADGSSSLELAEALHPSAAVCGTPTDMARALILELEGMDRGRYAGPVGWIDATGDGEWGIALRCAEIDPADPARLRLFAGCGIVAGSQPDAELAEADAKLVPMRDALSAP